MDTDILGGETTYGKMQNHQGVVFGDSEKIYVAGT